MDYLEMMETQSRIVEFEERLKEKISYLDESGNRKLDPYYFLSAEVAAYKILKSWINMMHKGQEFIDDHLLFILDLIELLLDEGYEDYQTYEADISMPLWYELTRDFDGEVLASFNAGVLVVASLAEISKGTAPEDTVFCTMSDDELTDANLASYAYSLAHDYLISSSREKLEWVAKADFGFDKGMGELYKLHFNLFQ